MGETISEAIGADHAHMDVCYNHIKSSDDETEKTRWRNELTWLVARHAISEELTMYPAMNHHLGEEGVKLTEIDKAQHQAVKDTLYKLQEMSPSDPSFQPLLDELMSNLHEHIEHEKNEDMPRLEGLLNREDSEALARSFQRTKYIVPTHSHPGAPTSYIFENLAALLAAPIDRFSDLLFKDFPTEADRKADVRL